MHITLEAAAILERALTLCSLLSYVILCEPYRKGRNPVWMVILKIFGVIPMAVISWWFWDMVINLFFRFKP